MPAQCERQTSHPATKAFSEIHNCVIRGCQCIVLQSRPVPLTCPSCTPLAAGPEMGQESSGGASCCKHSTSKFPLWELKRQIQPGRGARKDSNAKTWVSRRGTQYDTGKLPATSCGSSSCRGLASSMVGPAPPRPLEKPTGQKTHSRHRATEG